MTHRLPFDAETCNALFEMAEDVAHVGYWMWDIRTNEVKWSKTKIHIYGEDSQTFQSSFEAFVNMLDEETRKRVETEIQAVLKGEKPYYDLKHQIHLRNGRTAWVHEKAFVIRDEQGTPIRMEGVVFDITETMRLQATLKEEQERIAYLKLFNETTHLPNDKALRLTLERILAESPTNLTLCMVDIEDFGSINSTHGRDVGDGLLQAVAERLTKIFPNRIFHLHGDTFAIILPGVNMELQCHNLMETLHKPFEVKTQQFNLGFFAGCSHFPQLAQTADELMQTTQTALRIHRRQHNHQAKYLIYTPEMTQTLAQQRTRLNRLRKALASAPEAFTPFYQPQVHAQTGQIIGFEALVRWQQEDGSYLPPVEFLSLARQHGLLHQIDQAIMQQAIEQLRRWHEAGHGQLRLSINFEVTDLYSQLHRQALTQAGTLLPYLTFEITEEAFMRCDEAEFARLEAMKKAGVRLAIDDFGTGYSSLRYLHKLPVNEIKIDRFFITALLEDRNAQDILAIIKIIAERFGYHTVVEGVENQAELEYLMQEGFEVIQGFYYSRPVPADEASALLAARPWEKQAG